MNIHAIEQQLHQGKLSFASPERLMRYLGVKPGSVTPFGLINDVDHHVIVFVDRNFQQIPLGLCYTKLRRWMHEIQVYHRQGCR